MVCPCKAEGPGFWRVVHGACDRFSQPLIREECQRLVGSIHDLKNAELGKRIHDRKQLGLIGADMMKAAGHAGERLRCPKT